MVRRVRHSLPLKLILSFLKLTLARFNSWSKNPIPCLGSPFSLCRKSHPRQLTLGELRAIKKAFSDPDFSHWGPSSIAYDMINKNIIAANVQTITGHAKTLGLTHSLRPLKKSRKVGSISTSRPHEVWHCDITFVHTLDHHKFAIQFIQDNFSRKVLAFHITDNPSWEGTRAVLEQARELYCREGSPVPEILLSDAGTENLNTQVTQFTSSFSIRHLIAQRDVRFSNSVIEAWNKIFKYRYIFRKPIPTPVQASAVIQASVDDYNNRPHYLHKGLTPNQSCDGQLFDQAAYKLKIQKAAEHRLQINRQACQPCQPLTPEFSLKIKEIQ